MKFKLELNGVTPKHLTVLVIGLALAIAVYKNGIMPPGIVGLFK